MCASGYKTLPIAAMELQLCGEVSAVELNVAARNRTESRK